MVARFFVFSFFAIFFSALAFAEDNPTYQAGTVHVTSEKEGTPGDGSVFVTVIDLEKEIGTSKSTAEVLDRSVGLKVKNYGGLGAYSVAMIRGASPNQVSIYLDGVPLSQARSGVFNLGDLPLLSLEKIEVYRGFTPPQFSASAIGGVINLVTKKDSADKTFSSSVTRGSFNTTIADVMATGPAGPLNFIFHAETGRSDGDFSFKNDNGTPFNKTDDSWDLRENNDFKYHDLLGRVSGQFGGVKISVFENFYFKDNGVPGVGANQSEKASYEIARNVFDVNVDIGDAETDRVITSLGAYHLLTEEKFKDRLGEVGVGRQDNKNRVEKIGARSSVEIIDPLPGHYLVASMEGSVEKFNSENHLLNESREPERERKSFTAALLDEIYIGRWAFSPSLRYERFENDFKGDVFFADTSIAPAPENNYDNVSPKLGVALTVSEGLTVKGNIGRYFRAPDLTELFGDRGVVVGNSDLEPEEGLNFDIGLQLNALRFALLGGVTGFFEITYFYTDSDNLIVFVQNSQRTSMAENVGRATIMGVELSSAFTSASGISLSFNYTYQNTEDKSDVPHYKGNSLPDRPKHDLFARLEKVFGRFSVFYELNYTGTTYLDRANFKESRRGAVHNTGVTISNALFAGVRAGFEVKNFTDNQVKDAIGYPLPGRSFYVTLTWKGLM